MGWVKSIGIAVAVLVVSAGGGLACGGGGRGEVDLSDVDEVVAGAVQAVSRSGDVFHAEAVWREGQSRAEVQEVWLDADKGRFRRERRIERAGETTDFEVVVGADWTTTSYESFSNSVYTHTMTPPERAEGAEAGIDNFAYLGVEYLPILIGSGEKRVVGESTVEGRPVVSVEAEWFMEPGGDWPEGVTYAMNVELDKSTLLPVQVGTKLIAPDGEEQSYGPFTFEVTEYVSPEDLPPDFFSPQAVEELAVTLDEELAQAQAQAQAAGFALYWPGERYQAEELPELTFDGVRVDEKTVEVSLGYATEVAGFDLDDTVVIKQGPVGQTEFEPPHVRFGVAPEEGEEEVMVQDGEAVLYVSAEPPVAGPCVMEEEGVPCTPVVADVPAYHRLVLTLGNTMIQVEARARPQEEEDRNPFNNREALLAVAEALGPVPAQP